MTSARVKGIQRIHNHCKKIEYVHLKSFFRRNNLNFTHFMDSVDSDDSKHFLDYLIKFVGYNEDAANKCYHDAYDLYEAMMAVDENLNHYVMRTHSHNDRQQLWKVMSRPIQDKQDAISWMDHMKAEELREHPRSKHTFFIISKEEET